MRLGMTHVLCTGALLTAAAPALAADAPVWHDAGAGLPATVTLDAVAANAGIVVAAGTDGGVPVAYRFAGGTWTRTELAAAGTSGEAVDVAVDQFGRGWAVGRQQASPEAPVQALLARLAPDGTWTPVATGDAAPLTSVTASADLAFAGDITGAVRPLGADGLGTPLAYVAPGSVTAVRSLALTTGLAAIAGGVPASGTPGAAALLDVDGASNRVAQSPSVPADGGAEIVAVAALADGHRIALDGTACGTPAGAAPGAWLPDASTGAWRRDTTFPSSATARACDATFTPAGDALVAGSFDGRRTVWRRGTSWTRRDDLGAGELRGIAASADEAWAVGTGGTVLRYSVPPPPAPPVESSGGDPDSGGSPTGGSGDGDGSGGTQSADTSANDSQSSARQDSGAAQTTGSSQPEATPQPTVDVTVHAPEADPEPVALGHRPQRSASRLLGRLAVRALHGERLRLRFHLRLPARLEVRALRGTRVVARTSRRLGAGNHQLILPYRGTKPPTRLDIVVRRAPAGTSKENTR